MVFPHITCRINDHLSRYFRSIRWLFARLGFVGIFAYLCVRYSEKRFDLLMLTNRPNKNPFRPVCVVQQVAGFEGVLYRYSINRPCALTSTSWCAGVREEEKISPRWNVCVTSKDSLLTCITPP